MTQRLSDEWQRLVEEGQAPPAAGRSAEEAARDRQRKRPLTPSERRRRSRKVTLTLSPALLDELRRLCKQWGHAGEDGGGVIASRVVEQFLWLVIEAYQMGLIEEYEEQVTTTRQGFAWKSAARAGE